MASVDDAAGAEDSLMSYARTPLAIRFQPAMSGVMDGGAMPIVIGVVAVGAIVGIGYLIYKSSKNEREVRSRIAEKEGSAGLARYEDARTKRAAVEGGLGILSGLAWGAGGRHSSFRSGIRKNKGRARKTSRARP